MTSSRTWLTWRTAPTSPFRSSPPRSARTWASKDRGGPQLAVSDRAWSRFVQGIKQGEFDLA